MNILLWIVFGALVGFITSKVAKVRMDTFTMIIIGIIGSALGGLLASLIGLGDVTGFNIGSIIIGVIGSLILLYLVEKYVKR